MRCVLVILNTIWLIFLPLLPVPFAYLQIPVTYSSLLVFFFVPLGLIQWSVHLAMSLELSIWEPTIKFILFTWGSLLHFLTFITGKILGYFSGHFNRTWSSFYILHFLQLFLAKDHSSNSFPWSSSRCGMHNYSPFDTLIFIRSNLWQFPIIFLLILL